MLKIRLTRTGKRNKAQFRVVAAESSSPVKGRCVEILGSIDPYLNKVILNEERIKYRLSQGAKPSATVHNLLVDKKIIDAKKVTSWKPKKKEKTEEEKKESVESTG